MSTKILIAVLSAVAMASAQYCSYDSDCPQLGSRCVTQNQNGNSVLMCSNPPQLHGWARLLQIFPGFVWFIIFVVALVLLGCCLSACKHANLSHELGMMEHHGGSHH